MGEPHEVLLCMQGKRDGPFQQLAVFEGMGADGTRVAHLRSTDLGRAHASPVPPRARTSGVEDRRPRTSPSLPTGTTASPREETDKAAKGASAPVASRPESTQSRLGSRVASCGKTNRRAAQSTSPARNGRTPR